MLFTPVILDIYFVLCIKIKFSCFFFYLSIIIRTFADAKVPHLLQRGMTFLKKKDMGNSSDTAILQEATPQVVSAGGVPKAEVKSTEERRWYVAIVKRNTEKSTREQLEKLGYETYVASQKELHQWSSGLRKEVERVVISTIVFVHVTEKERLLTLKFPFVNRYMTNKAAPANDLGRHPVATIPDSQMQQLQFMLYHADSRVDFVENPLRRGEHIRVVRGCLKGFEGEVVRMEGTTYVVATIGLLGSAMVTISPADIERAKA